MHEEHGTSETTESLKTDYKDGGRDRAPVDEAGTHTAKSITIWIITNLIKYPRSSSTEPKDSSNAGNQVRMQVPHVVSKIICVQYCTLSEEDNNSTS